MIRNLDAFGVPSVKVFCNPEVFLDHYVNQIGMNYLGSSLLPKIVGCWDLAAPFYLADSQIVPT